MLDKITQAITTRMQKEIPDMDDERMEVINFGLQILFGEIPKIFIMLGLAWILGVFKVTLLTFLLLLPYRGFSGGFHLKTHIGCIISTTAFYCGVAFLAKNIVLDSLIKYLFILFTLIFGIIMIKQYAPADTEDVPILSKRIRKQKQILSYIFLVIGLVIAALINNSVISNIIIFGYIVQTCMITKLAYKLTKNRYGYEVYTDTSSEIS